MTLSKAFLLTALSANGHSAASGRDEEAAAMRDIARATKRSRMAIGAQPKGPQPAGAKILPRPAYGRARTTARVASNFIIQPVSGAVQQKGLR